MPKIQQLIDAQAGPPTRMHKMAATPSKHIKSCSGQVLTHCTARCPFQCLSPVKANAGGIGDPTALQTSNNTQCRLPQGTVKCGEVAHLDEGLHGICKPHWKDPHWAQ